MLNWHNSRLEYHFEVDGWILFGMPNIEIETENLALTFLTLVDLNVEPTTGNYYPTIFFNEFWLLRDKLVRINETVKELVLNLEVAPISMTKWQLFLQIDQSFQIHRSYGSMLEGEADELKVLTLLKLGFSLFFFFSFFLFFFFFEQFVI